jgi:hypothetical protein
VQEEVLDVMRPAHLGETLAKQSLFVDLDGNEGMQASRP